MLLRTKIQTLPDSFSALACVTGDYEHKIDSHQKLLFDYFSDGFHLYGLFVHLNGRYLLFSTDDSILSNLIHYICNG